MPFTEGHQSPGNPIPSGGWNNMVDEIKRLAAAKLDVAGGTVTGPLAVQQSLAVTGTASTGNASVGGSLTVAGPANVGSALSVNGALTAAGTAAVAGTATFGSARVGGGAGAPADTLDVVGNMRVGVGANPVRFTSGWSGFPDAATNQAEISNDTGVYKRLMIVGNKSVGDNVRRVGLWDLVMIGDTGGSAARLEVNGQSCARSFCNLSDGRLKTDVTPIGDPLGRLTRLRGVSFRWLPDAVERPDGAPGAGVGAGLDGAAGPGADAGPDVVEQPASIGVVAQEVAQVFPELISTIGDQRQLGVDYGGLTAVLIEAVKQLAASNDELRRRVAALEASGPAAA